MNNFEHFETREFNLGLLNEMYNVPSKELPTKRIVEILSIVFKNAGQEQTGQLLDAIMVSAIFKSAGLNLRERARVAPKNVEVKPKRVTKAEKVNNILGLLGLTPAVNGETNEEPPVEEEEMVETEQEVQAVDEVIETEQLGRNTESIYSNGVNN